MWAVYAGLSALFASLTAILGKIGVQGINSNLATDIRTIFVLVMAWGMVFITGAQSCMKDIGVLASLDPVAIDQACLDLVYAAKDDPGRAHLLKRIESRHGVFTIEAAAALGVGQRDYELVEID